VRFKLMSAQRIVRPRRRYERQKGEVEDLVLMSVTHAAEYAHLAAHTRKDGTCQRPKARASFNPVTPPVLRQSAPPVQCHQACTCCSGVPG
jgi:hypothetical protein